MKVSKEQAAANRERIIDAASSLFRAKGFDGIGVADIMKAADLTHGGFYGHFASKDDLVAQATGRSAGRAAQNWRRVVERAPERPYAALLDHYLTPRHRDEPGRGCVFAALGNDAARGGGSVKAAYAQGVEALVDILAQSVPGRTKAVRRRRAVAAMAGLIGALTLSRAVGHAPLADEILDAVHRELLAAAGR